MPKKLLKSLKPLKPSDKLITKGRKRAAIDNDEQDKELIVPILVKHIKLETKSEESYVQEVNVKPQVNIFHLNSDVWRVIFENFTENDIINLSSVSIHFQQMVQNIKSGFNLRLNYLLDVSCFLNYALSTSCTTIDINYCKWLTPSTIKQMISKTNIQHFHALQCQIDRKCARSFCNRQLQSLSITYASEWKIYFKHFKKSLPIAQTITKLEIEYNLSVCYDLHLNGKSFICDIYESVLQHCKELQHFKLVEVADYEWNGTNHSQPSKFPSKSTPLPKLTSLELIFVHDDCRSDLLSFLKAILKDKTIPLKNVDLGIFTCYLLKHGILRHPLILHNSSRFTFRCHRKSFIEVEDYKYYDDYKNEICTWMDQTTYKAIFVENIYFEDFASFVDRIVSISGQSIKEVIIYNCSVFKNTLKGIELFAINCPQITVVHFVIVEVAEFQQPNSCDAIAKNEAIIEALSNLKNLKVLVISPTYLRCEYTNQDGSEVINILPFWKVTQCCKHLEEIHFQHPTTLSYQLPPIHANCIYDIANCKHLRVLQLCDLVIIGNKHFQLSEITKNCNKLQHLSIDIAMNDIHKDNYILGNCLSYTKDLKILSINCGRRFLTKGFIKCLSLCTKLQNIDFELFESSDELGRDVKNLMKVLSKLKSLFVIRIGFDDAPLIKEQLNSCFEKIQTERPAFSFTVE